MQRWSEEFSKVNPNIQIIYFAVGSGTGITNFTDGIVDFAASDAAMTDEQPETRADAAYRKQKCMQNPVMAQVGR